MPSISPTPKPGRWWLPLFIGLCCASNPAGAQTPEERIERLERALEEERARGAEQADRIRQLELSLLTVLDAPPAAGPDEAALEALIAEEVARATEDLRAPARDWPRIRTRTQARFVYRVFDGADISTDQSLELEHIIATLDIRLSEEFRLVFSPGVSHTGTVAILETYGAYRFADWLEVAAGRFIVPFTGVHAWAFPSDSFIEPYLAPNSPRPFLYSPWWDEGLMATGSVPFGSKDQHRFKYSAYVINGFDAQGLDGFHKRTIGDNNENKTLGARLSATFRLGSDASLTVGAAAMTGKYDSDDELSFFAVEGDIEVALGDFQLYGEVLYRPQEIEARVVENMDATLVEVARMLSIKLRPQYRITPSLAVFAQFDYLMVRQPPRFGGLFSVDALGDEEFTVRTALLGLKYDINAHLRVVLEGGIFARDSDLGPDIRFVALSLYYAF
jgi:hypothetical protein